MIIKLTKWDFNRPVIKNSLITAPEKSQFVKLVSRDHDDHVDHVVDDKSSVILLAADDDDLKL